MKIYVFDKAGKRKLDTWESLVDYRNEIVPVKDFSLTNVININSNNLVIVHRTDFASGGKLLPEAHNWIDNYEGYVLLIAGSWQQPLNDFGKENIYCRMYPVKEVEDQEFSKCFKKLIQELEVACQKRIAPRWSQIEPQKYPENLLATYFLDVAMSTMSTDDKYTCFLEQLQSSSDEICRDITENAHTEFQDFGGEENKWSDMEPKKAAISDILKRVKLSVG